MKSVYSKPINPPNGNLQTVTAKPGPLSQNVGGVSYVPKGYENVFWFDLYKEFHIEALANRNLCWCFG